MLAKIYRCVDGSIKIIAIETGEIEEIIEKWKDECIIEIVDEERNKRLMVYINL